MSLSRVTAPTILEMTKSISCSVVKRPIPKRKLEWAMSSLAPSARRTYDGSSEADVQAEPDERAMSLRSMMSDSPSTKANERLTQPG